jgi:SPP1 Gp6-like portal protein
VDVTVSTLVTAPAFNILGGLSAAEEALRLRLISQLARVRKANRRQYDYYEGARRVRDLGIAIPPHLRDLEAVAGWPEIVVDVMDERSDWHGWLTPGVDLELDAVYEANALAVESGSAILDSLICGLSFLVVGTGDAGEPDVLITAESPSRLTGTWSSRLRRLTDALVELCDVNGALIGWQLYLPNETIRAERRNGRVEVVDRDVHGLGRVPVAVLRNRPRASRVDGRSEITRAVRSITNSGMRTLLGMEVTREFFAAPQRWLMGADEAMFVGPDGEKRSQWDAVIGHMLSIPRDEDGELPVAGQFAAQSPEPTAAMLRTYAQMISASSGVPATHLGFTTDNPASADAIREANSRLDKRAIRRHLQYDLGLRELGVLAVLWRDGELPPAGVIGSRWGDPSTPTPAAAADRMVKLVGAGLVPADSDVALEHAGFSETDIARIKADRRRAAARDTIRRLTAAADTARTDPTVADLADRTGTGDVPAPGPAA